MVGLAEDILVEILARLPVKSIDRVRCVSKSWNALISEDYRQRKRLPTAMAGLIFEHRLIRRISILKTSHTSCRPDFRSPPFRGDSKIVSVCNGLVLCSNSMRTHFAVCNPIATRRWKSLRKPDNLDLLAIGFDPRLSRHYRVLGYCKKDSTYKFKMFLSETDGWVDCAGDYGLDEPSTTTCVFLNGIFHVSRAVYRAVEDVIFTVDREKSNCRRVALPYHVPETWSQSRIGVSDGLLHLAMQSGNELLVWALDDYYGNDQWVLKHIVSFPEIEKIFKNVKLYPSGLDGCTLLHFHPDEDVIFLHVKKETLVSYNFTTGNVEVIRRSTHFMKCSAFHPFSPCFSSNEL